MKTKLTLRLDREVIKKAKEYSSKRGESVSSMVEKFFKAVSAGEEEITPTVRRLKGFLKNSQVKESDYEKFLEEKYL